jgi:hypothetical protein
MEKVSASEKSSTVSQCSSLSLVFTLKWLLCVVVVYVLTLWGWYLLFHIRPRERENRLMTQKSMLVVMKNKCDVLMRQGLSAKRKL